MLYYTIVEFANIGTDYLGVYQGGFLQYEAERALVLEWLYERMIPAPVQITQVVSSLDFVVPVRLVDIG